MSFSSILFGPPKPKVSHIQFPDNSISDLKKQVRDEYERWGRSRSRTGSLGRHSRRVIRRKTRFRKEKNPMTIISPSGESYTSSLRDEDEDNSKNQKDESATGFDCNVKRVAFNSRVIVLFLQIFARLIFPSHQNDGFKTPRPEGNFMDRLVNTTLGGFTNWDGEYFLHLTTKGYTHVNTIAFFPLFPNLVALPSYVLSSLPPFAFGLLTFHSIAMVVGWCLNTWLFMESVLALKKLVRCMDNRMTGLIPIVTYLYCFNPASIFFSAYYSETLFSYLTINMMTNLYRSKYKDAITCAAFGTVCRSNGLLNFGFVLAFIVRDGFVKKKPTEGWIGVIYQTVQGVFYCVIGLFPFIYFQFFCVWKFCDPLNKTGADVPPFCDFGVLPYSYVQSTFWSVGFLQYFTVRQVPNFLLATPILVTTTFEAFKRVRFYSRTMFEGSRISLVFLPELALGCHALFLVLFCIFFAHVQISTRMIMSACPYLYVYIAKTIRTDTYLFRRRKIDWPIYTFLINSWFGVYFILGSACFSIGLPWT